VLKVPSSHNRTIVIVRYRRTAETALSTQSSRVVELSPLVKPFRASLDRYVSTRKLRRLCIWSFAAATQQCQQGNGKSI